MGQQARRAQTRHALPLSRLQEPLERTAFSLSLRGAPQASQEGAGSRAGEVGGEERVVRLRVGNSQYVRLQRWGRRRALLPQRGVLTIERPVDQAAVISPGRQIYGGRRRLMWAEPDTADRRRQRRSSKHEAPSGLAKQDTATCNPRRLSQLRKLEIVGDPLPWGAPDRWSLLRRPGSDARLGRNLRSARGHRVGAIG